MKNIDSFTWAAIKENFTFTIPYWAVFILIIAAFEGDGKYLKGFLLFYTVMIGVLQKKAMHGFPGGLIRFMQGFLIIVTLVFLFASLIDP